MMTLPALTLTLTASASTPAREAKTAAISAWRDGGKSATLPAATSVTNAEYWTKVVAPGAPGGENGLGGGGLDSGGGVAGAGMAGGEVGGGGGVKGGLV